jgi:hypothetical protein
MGNYESFRTEATVEIDVKPADSGRHTIEDEYAGANEIAESILAKALAKDIAEAAEVTLTQNSFILTMEL